MNSLKAADMILKNGKITTLDPRHPEAKSVAIKDGRIVGHAAIALHFNGPLWSSDVC